jgi:hypothetical protein
METCDEIKDPSNVQLKVRIPLTEEDKLADLPSHASQRKKTSDNLQHEFCVSVKVVKKKLNKSVNTFEGGLLLLLLLLLLLFLL